MTDQEPTESLLACVLEHVEWLHAMADSVAMADLPKTATALEAAAERLEAEARRLRDHLALGDTAVLSVGDFADEGS